MEFPFTILQVTPSLPLPPEGSAYSLQVLAVVGTILLGGIIFIYKYTNSIRDKHDARRDEAEKLRLEREAKRDEDEKVRAAERDDMLRKMEAGRESRAARALDELRGGFADLREDSAELRGRVGEQLETLRGQVKDTVVRGAGLTERITAMEKQLARIEAIIKKEK